MMVVVMLAAAAWTSAGPGIDVRAGGLLPLALGPWRTSLLRWLLFSSLPTFQTEVTQKRLGWGHSHLERLAEGGGPGACSREAEVCHCDLSQSPDSREREEETDVKTGDSQIQVSGMWPSRSRQGAPECLRPRPGRVWSQVGSSEAGMTPVLAAGGADKWSLVCSG